MTAVGYNNSHLTVPLKGACHCGNTKYVLNALPIRVNCCHCRDCQNKTGSAFMTNVIVEKSNVHVTSENQPFVTEHSPGISIARCSSCFVSLWSTIPSLGPNVLFVRAGTLENTRDIVPDIHFFTRTKVNWVKIPDDVKTYVAGRPDGEPAPWTEEGKRRIEAVIGKIN